MRHFFERSLRQGNTDLALLVVRVSIALLMLTHGLPKMAKLFSGEPVAFASIFGMSATLSLGLAVFAEVVCSFFLLAGLATRFATVPLMATMAIAAFYYHAGDPFGDKEMAILYQAGYIALFIAGGGKYSIDYKIAGSGSIERK